VDVEGLQQQLQRFAEERDWERFHSPKNLAMALAGEAGELLEIFQWISEEESRNLPDEDAARVREELADLQIYLLRIADVLRVTIEDAVAEKLRLNEQRYPVDEAYGNATKYSRRGP
jgi:NTP pyrophosphatase (non-canonical NTP hydrolase)